MASASETPTPQPAPANPAQPIGEHGIQRPSQRRWIAVWLIVGVILRAYPMFWSSAFYDEDQFALHPDESKIVRYADDFPDSLWTNDDFRYPLLVHHAGSLAWWPIKTLFGWGGNEVYVQWSERKLDIPEEASMVGEWSYERALLFLRGALVLLYGLGGTLLLIVFTRRLGFPTAAPWVAAAAATQPFPVASTAIVQTDTAGAYMLFLVFFVALGVERKGSFGTRAALALGAALGGAIAARYTSGVGLIGILTLAASAVRSRRLSWLGAVLFLAKAGAATAVTFVAIVPGSLYRFARFKKSILFEYHSKQAITTLDIDQFWSSLTQCAPVFILGPTLVGAILIARRGRYATSLGVFLSLGVYFAATAKSLQPDYAMPIAPVAAVCTGIAFAWAVRSGGRARVGTASAYILFLLGATCATVHERYAGDTRYLVSAWIKDNIPPGDLGFPRSPIGRKRTALRAPAGYRFVDVYDAPEWVVIPHRRFRPIYKVYEDPNFFPGYPFDPDKKTLGKLGPRDFEFFEDVLFQERKRYRYDLAVEFERSPWPLDYRGHAVRVYRRSSD